MMGEEVVDISYVMINGSNGKDGDAANTRRSKVVVDLEDERG